MSQRRLEITLSATLTVAAVVLAATVLAGEVRARSVVPPASSLREPARISDWESLPSRVLYNAGPGSISIVEFADLECPACRVFHQTVLPALKERFGEKIRVEMIHFPLPTHKFARMAAIAAECAERQARMPEMVQLLYQHQDSIGLRSWNSYAQAAGVVDSSAFSACMSSPTASQAVDSSQSIADRLGLRSTPTVAVNGWVIGHTVPEMSRVINDLLRHRNPFPEVDSSRLRRLVWKADSTP
ncbi:MAG: DsbA family protein [Gemmatimonadetes bacterium]|nr:DsbA family protein [Gemmatimonadota bacterium]